MTLSAPIRNAESSVNQPSITLATLYRLSGASLVAGCALLALGDVVRVVSGSDPSNPLLAAGWFIQSVGAMLALLAVPGLYVRIAVPTGLAGLVGILGITLFLFYFGVFGGLVHALAVPGLAKQGASRPIPVDLGFIAAAVFATIGSLALGIGVLRSRTLPRSAAILLMAGGTALFVGHPLGMHLEDLGLAMLVAALGWAGLRLASPPE